MLIKHVSEIFNILFISSLGFLDATLANYSDTSRILFSQHSMQTIFLLSVNLLITKLEISHIINIKLYLHVKYITNDKINMEI